MKTRSWKFATRHVYCTFQAHDFKRKTVFIGPLKPDKNVLSKSDLIGLFVINNRTMGELKNLQREQERQLSSGAFPRPVTAGPGNWGWVFERPVKMGSRVNGLIKE